jgi:CRP-like cAMP-binding protein
MATNAHLAAPQRNRILRALPGGEIERLSASLEYVEMPLASVMYEAGSPMWHAFFPTSGIVSLLSLLHDGATVEIAMIGNCGLVGTSTLVGARRSLSRAIVQAPTTGYRIKASVLNQEFHRGGPLHDVVLRFTEALMTQMAQNAVCNRHHDIQNQLCRWMLMTLDRMEGNEIAVTQELISNMLGVRREGVSTAAAKLTRLGHIECQRGRITVRDRAALEKCACECYGIVRREYDRLLDCDAMAGQPRTSPNSA